MPFERPDQRLRTRRIAPWLTAVILVASPAMAGEYSKLSLRDGEFPDPALTVIQQTADPEFRVARTKQFFRGHFLPEVTSQLKRVAMIVDLVATPTMSMSQHPMSDEYTRRARSQFQRATRDAIRDYLLEETTLRRVTQFFERRSAGSSAQGRKAGTVAFGLGVYGSEPQLVMRYRMSNSSIKLRLGIEGSAKLDFRTSRMTNTHVVAGYDPSREQYGLSYRLDF